MKKLIAVLLAWCATLFVPSTVAAEPALSFTKVWT
jgi:hypothetical protein